MLKTEEYNSVVLVLSNWRNSVRNTDLLAK